MSPSVVYLPLLSCRAPTEHLLQQSQAAPEQAEGFTECTEIVHLVPTNLFGEGKADCQKPINSKLVLPWPPFQQCFRNTDSLGGIVRIRIPILKV